MAGVSPGFAVRTGRDVGLDPSLLVDLRRAALFHDAGKLLVPIAYLEKPGQLTDAERRVIDEHARTTAAVLGRSRALARLAPLVVAHHERLDGNGMFPTLADEPVAMAARVLALSDRYEAMTAERPYRSLLSPTQVWSILDEVVGEPMATDRAARPPARRGRGALSGRGATRPRCRRGARPTRTPGRRRCRPWRCSARPGPRPAEARDDRREVRLAGVSELDADVDGRGQVSGRSSPAEARSTARRAARATRSRATDGWTESAAR